MIGLLLAAQMFSPTDPSALRPVYEKAIVLRAREFGEKSPEAARTMVDYAGFLGQSGDGPKAVEWLRKSLAIQSSLETKQMLAVLLEPLDAAASLELHLEIATQGTGEMAAASEARIGELAEREGDIRGAEKAYRQAVAQSVVEDKLAVRLNTLALLLKAQTSKNAEAEALFRRAIAIQQRRLGAKHPELGTTLNNLSGLLLDLNRPAEAEPVARRALSVFDGSVGPEHVRSALAASNLADILGARGLKAQARPLYERALRVFERRLGPNHAWTMDARAALRP